MRGGLLFAGLFCSAEIHSFCFGSADHPHQLGGDLFSPTPLVEDMP